MHIDNQGELKSESPNSGKPVLPEAASAQLSIEDYKSHRSFVRMEEEDMFYRLIMKADKTVTGEYMALDNRIVPNEYYEVAFPKRF